MVDSVDKLSAATGLRRDTLLEIWDDVTANNNLLSSCSRHDFECTDPTRLSAKWRCSACGGTVSGNAAYWYNIGRSHG